MWLLDLVQMLSNTFTQQQRARRCYSDRWITTCGYTKRAISAEIISNEWVVTVFGSELNRNESWRKRRVWMINGYYESIINSWLTSMLALRCSLEVGSIRSYKGRPHEWCIDFIFCWIVICRCLRNRNGSKLHAADCNHQMVKVILSNSQTYAHMQDCVCQRMLSVYSYQLSVN